MYVRFCLCVTVKESVVTSSLAMRMWSLTPEKMVGWMKSPLSATDAPPHSSLAPSFLPLSMRSMILPNCSLSIWSQRRAHNKSQSLSLVPPPFKNTHETKVNTVLLLILPGARVMSGDPKGLLWQSSLLLLCSFAQTLHKYFPPQKHVKQLCSTDPGYKTHLSGFPLLPVALWRNKDREETEK